ncbi:hypothetical protein CHH83_18855 [Bacillus sp. 7586-K]|nr:hypothetical protein CHH83_18855 [Bacillus sp. 7586-K]
MSEKIKVSYEEVSKALTSINQSANALQYKTSSTAEQNRLEFVNKMNEVNTMITQLAEQYKQLLKEHNQQVEQSLEALKLIDESLAALMDSFSQGVKQALEKE